jgi:hypothetical protein
MTEFFCVSEAHVLGVHSGIPSAPGSNNLTLLGFQH